MYIQYVRAQHTYGLRSKDLSLSSIILPTFVRSFRLADINFFSKMTTTDDDTIIDQTLSERLLEKGQKSPFLVASLISLAGICGYGVYAFKKKKISTQLYLIQLRVAAQGTAIACLTIGMGYHMIKKHILHDENEP